MGRRDVLRARWMNQDSDVRTRDTIAQFERVLVFCLRRLKACKVLGTLPRQQDETSLVSSHNLVYDNRYP